MSSRSGSPDGTPPGPSSRVSLEVALLAGNPRPPATSPPPRAGAHLVSVAADDADLRGYVRECLRARPDVRVVEDADDEGRPPPHLVITDQPGRGGAIPRLILADEAPAESGSGPGAGHAPLEVLAKPFNARQLLEAVERLLGSPR